MKKLSTVAAALLAAGAIASSPSVDAAAATLSATEQVSDNYAPVGAQDTDESAPSVTFYASAVGDMFKCGGSFGKLWCK